MHACMHAWPDGGMDGWTDEWMDGSRGVNSRTCMYAHIAHVEGQNSSSWCRSFNNLLLPAASTHAHALSGKFLHNYYHRVGIAAATR